MWCECVQTALPTASALDAVFVRLGLPALRGLAELRFDVRVVSGAVWDGVRYVVRDGGKLLDRREVVREAGALRPVMSFALRPPLDVPAGALVGIACGDPHLGVFDGGECGATDAVMWSARTPPARASLARAHVEGERSARLGWALQLVAADGAVRYAGNAGACSALADAAAAASARARGPALIEHCPLAGPVALVRSASAPEGASGRNEACRKWCAARAARAARQGSARPVTRRGLAARAAAVVSPCTRSVHTGRSATVASCGGTATSLGPREWSRCPGRTSARSRLARTETGRASRRAALLHAGPGRTGQSRRRPPLRRSRS